MKHLTCKICGGMELNKKDGFFVCKICGTEYSVDEINSMMRGDSDASASYAVSYLEELYDNARSARADMNIEEAARYYRMISEEDPNSWEAFFFSVYFEASRYEFSDIQSSGIAISNSIRRALILIRDRVDGREGQTSAVKEISYCCTELSDKLHADSVSHYKSLDAKMRDNYTQDFLNNCCAARNIMYVLGNNIDSVFSEYEELRIYAVTAWKNGIGKHNSLMKYLAAKSASKSIMEDYAAKVRKYEPTYSFQDEGSTKGRCYIATAVYGSYDCPEVWTLRRYRDNVLAETWYGRAFIRSYYTISPTFVRWFGKTTWFKRMWQMTLDRIVKRLNAKGFENTPYKDK